MHFDTPEDFEAPPLSRSQIRIAAKIGLVILAEALLLGALMFTAAGTLDWEWAWLLAALATLSLLPAVAGLARHAPELLEARTRLAPKGQPLADRLFVPAHSALILAWAWITGLDAAHPHWWPVPETLRATAALAIPLATWAGYRTMRENPWLATCVCLQDERAHRVVDTGAYGMVRHPFYAITLGYQLCASLTLGSCLGAATTGAVALLLGLRIGIEERFLERALPGYAAYKRRTPWRLVPGVW